MIRFEMLMERRLMKYVKNPPWMLCLPVGYVDIGYRNEFADAMVSAMKNAVLCGDHQGLETLFESNLRAKCYLKEGWIDINASLDEKNERSILHLAAKSDNAELVVWCLKYGADPNVKDNKGKRPVDLVKAEKIKDLLKHAKSQAPILSASLAQATSSNHPSHSGAQIREAPTVKGTLNKVMRNSFSGQTIGMAINLGILS
jgi:hypothetical protein